MTITKRVTAAPRGTQVTSRFHSLLLLEGDESGYLLLEGDMADLDTDVLKLEGDEPAVGGTVTKRLTETVA